MKNLKLFALSATTPFVITSCQKDEIIDNIHTEIQLLKKMHQDALWKAGVNPN
ncbi:hypothetical protein [uncultured Aquimarina sp.]|uniref:hypothetical protein n=1 Tax=uncultured Aquimarina sp. TaxID=575652 RepID=UPI002636BF18|nr:hypothetical protein [uncultured Aquimarina sp.]